MIQKVRQKMSSQSIEDFLDELTLRAWDATPDQTEKFAPLCIWGRAGIGKTALIRSYAKSKGIEFAYFAPAQIEELGDLYGMPYRKEDQTLYAPPQWVPTTEGPGILLIDDVNRADYRLMNAMLQLFQDYALNAWSLPSKWFIVLTANPDQLDYKVQRMDRAVEDRLIHVEMEFSMVDWLRWATNYGLPEYCLQFVTLFSEVFQDLKNSPRAWVNLFSKLSPEGDDNLDFVKALAYSSLEAEAALCFVNFYSKKEIWNLSCEDLIQWSGEEVNQRLALFRLEDEVRTDFFVLFGQRLLLFLESKPKWDEQSLSRAANYWLSPHLPNDVRMLQLGQMAKSKSKNIQKILNMSAIQEILMKHW